MDSKKLLKLAHEAGYILDKEYNSLLDLVDSELKRRIRPQSRPWLRYTKKRGVYKFNKLSKDQIKSLENQWTRLLPEEVKNSDLRGKIHRRVNDTLRNQRASGKLSEKDWKEAVKIFRGTLQADTVDELEIALELLNDPKYGNIRRFYSPEYAREYNIDVNEKLYNSDKEYKSKINKLIKRAQNSEAKRLLSGDRFGSLKRQTELLAQSREAYGKEFAKQGYRHWLKQNPNAIIGDAGTWWDLQPDYARQNWYDLGAGIQKQNNIVYDKYQKLGKVAPSSEIMQWHHLMPKSFGGVHAPENIIGAMGNAFKDVGSRHAKLHDLDIVRFEPTYQAAKSAGMGVLPFEPDDPKIFEKSGAVKKSGMMTFMDILGSIGKKALGPLGAAFALDAAQNYWTEGKPVRASLAAASALPVIGLPAAAGEGLINASEWVYNQPTVYPEEPYYGMGRQRGLLEGHAGIGEEEQKRRTNIWT